MTTQVEILQFLHYIPSLSRVYLTDDIPIRNLNRMGILFVILLGSLSF